MKACGGQLMQLSATLLEPCSSFLNRSCPKVQTILGGRICGACNIFSCFNYNSTRIRKFPTVPYQVLPPSPFPVPSAQPLQQMRLKPKSLSVLLMSSLTSQSSRGMITSSFSG
ncbi:hypothetical protein DVH24_037843 [Malus domestica]|uniref:Uncharacterized protein n=1 Tax=Malus domestica TaxID=3750 RepID=A0A498K2Y0_MALDO|nr:hypothetical protein DVH24_037843 [Malus domestica]